MTTKRDIDQKIAAMFGYPLAEVSVITSSFLRLIVHELARGEHVELVNFGTVFITQQDGVRVKKSGTLRRLLQRLRAQGANMEKYGVDEGADEHLEKRASEDCPKCGSKVAVHGRVLVCPKCGTAPFEGEPSK